ncbi:MAG: tRNA pseudouridine(13) synthase TruD [Planctomycetota bacterium]|nr:tRNA pseudouridine(13) synthase TruD [Planctomycetota bacterium]
MSEPRSGPAAAERADAFPSRALPSVYVTADLPPLGGAIKRRPEDFLVDEQLLNHPCGRGEHIHMLVEKRGLSTTQMLRIIAGHFGVDRRALGYAGMKDKLAITRQVVSVHAPGKSLHDFRELRHDRVSILWADQHTERIRLGQCRGNRFSIRIRDVDYTGVVTARRALERLAKNGVPNRFGEQRFGVRDDNHIVGRALLLRRWDDVIRGMLSPDESGEEKADSEARRLFAAGDYRAAAKKMPPWNEAERRVLEALARGATPEKVVGAMGKTQRRFLASAFQSAVFNAVLERRIEDGTYCGLEEGDIAWSEQDGEAFEVDAAALNSDDVQTRLKDGSIGPSGPLWGPKMRRADARPGEIERSALADAGVSESDLEKFDPELGVRRPRRTPLRDPEVESGVDEHGSFVRCAFELAPGAFATVVMEEVMKSGGSMRDGASEGDE